MNTFSSLSAAAIFLCAFIFTLGIKDSKKSRVYAIVASCFAITLAFLGLALKPSTLSHDLLLFSPLNIALIALLASGLAPLRTHQSSTFSSMMLLASLAEAFLVFSNPLVLALLWTLSALTLWLELKRLNVIGVDRVFALYQGASIFLFFLGAITILYGRFEWIGIFLLLSSIGIREGFFPAQSWLLCLTEKAPLGLVVLFIAPKLGVHTHLSLLEQTSKAITPIIAFFGVFTSILAALLAFTQKKSHRTLAYLILSQTGLITFGLESSSEVSLNGALLIYQVSALATSGFAMTLAALEARRGILNLSTPQGNFSQTPKLGLAFLFLGFASVGFPLTLGFIAEDLLLQGAIKFYPLSCIAMILATALNGMTVLRMFFYLFTGDSKNTHTPDLFPRESTILTLCSATLFILGLAPMILF